MQDVIVLVVDKIYQKTHRQLEKLRNYVSNDATIILATVFGFGQGLSTETVSNLVNAIITDTIEGLAGKVRNLSQKHFGKTFIIALNESAILPAVALRKALGILPSNGYIESCDKFQTRSLLSLASQDLALPCSRIVLGEPNNQPTEFTADKFVVKPAFGMSSHGVTVFDTWNEALTNARAFENKKEWVPSNVSNVLDNYIGRTDAQIIEPFIDGTEFSIDGWIVDNVMTSIVQHKLYMVHLSFIGDGPTVSPPLRQDQLPPRYSGLSNDEATIQKFGARILDAIGFRQGVFHIEAREQRSDLKLVLIEINPRAPGGSLWKSALLRTGYDLELIDGIIQIGMPVPKPVSETRPCVLHYPFYAKNPGKLIDWGDLKKTELLAREGITIDFAATLEQPFTKQDLAEEPYLAFAVAHADNTVELLRKNDFILSLRPPTIR